VEFNQSTVYVHAAMCCASVSDLCVCNQNVCVCVCERERERERERELSNLDSDATTVGK
jgi:hypothetical protein